MLKPKALVHVFVAVHVIMFSISAGVLVCMPVSGAQCSVRVFPVEMGVSVFMPIV